MKDADRRENFAAYVRQRLGGDRAKLMRKTGLSKGRITQLFDQKEPFGERAAANLTDALGLPAGYFEKPAPVEDLQPPKGGHWVEGPRIGVTSGNWLSLVEPTIEPRTILWESLLSEPLPQQFKMAVPDDALAPAYPAGSLFIWSTVKEARVGSVVLVRDEFGQPHARRHGQGRAPGQWVAEATGPGFLPFSGAAVTLLAVAEEERRPMP